MTFQLQILTQKCITLIQKVDKISENVNSK